MPTGRRVIADLHDDAFAQGAAIPHREAHADGEPWEDSDGVGERGIEDGRAPERDRLSGNQLEARRVERAFDNDRAPEGAPYDRSRSNAVSFRQERDSRLEIGNGPSPPVADRRLRSIPSMGAARRIDQSFIFQNALTSRGAHRVEFHPEQPCSRVSKAAAYRASDRL